MCDSFAAVPPTTRDGVVIFGKAADCQVNEAHHLLMVPHMKHPAGSLVKITHIVIPQAEETYQILLSKSFWTWGAEIGVNEYGLGISNEAIHTNIELLDRRDGVITMDLVRIGLERGRNCREAIEAMGAALKAFGQGGNCELSGNSHFDASYMLADSKEAWVLETAGTDYAARQVQGQGAISNVISFGSDWQLSSLVDPAAARVDWRERFAKPDPAFISSARHRLACSQASLAKDEGHIDIHTAFALLRDHDHAVDPTQGEAVSVAVCAHPGGGAERRWQTTGALATEANEQGTITWATGTAGTCLSIFKPIFVDAGGFDGGPAPCETYDPESLWWLHERMHRRVELDFSLQPEIRADFDQLEARFLADSRSVLASGSAAQKRQFTEHCFNEARQATERWAVRLEKKTFAGYPDNPIGENWKVLNAAAAFSL
jgi:secernin